jgi:hypothetical protein
MRRPNSIKRLDATRMRHRWTHSDDDLVRRFSSVALRRGEHVIADTKRKLIETSSEEAQLKRIMIREYCRQEGLTEHSSFGFQKHVITKAMAHFELKRARNQTGALRRTNFNNRSVQCSEISFRCTSAARQRFAA